MKSAPAIIATSEARATLRRLPSSPVARIALRCAGPQAARKARISSKSACQSPVRTWRREITMSISLLHRRNAGLDLGHPQAQGRKTGRKPADTAATGMPLPASAWRAGAIIS